MIDYQAQSKLLELIGKTLKRTISVYVIGGSAMMYYQAKQNTKDIDVVTTTEEDFREIIDALQHIGFSERIPFLHTKYKEIQTDKPKMLQLKDERIDIFLNKIICFTLSESMKARITQRHEYRNLICNIVSPEDIILLKSATERAGDRQDAKGLIENYNIKWDVIIAEAEHQTELGQDLFVVFLYDFLEELKEDLKADVPLGVLRKIRKIAEKAMIKAMKEKKNVSIKRGT